MNRCFDYPFRNPLSSTGTGCRKHRQVSLLAAKLPSASLIFFFERREHGPPVPDIKRRCVQQAGWAPEVVS